MGMRINYFNSYFNELTTYGRVKYVEERDASQSVYRSEDVKRCWAEESANGILPVSRAHHMPSACLP